MVVGAFPIVKLGSLLLRQISKPIANYVKEKAKNNVFFRTYVCMPPAQFYNWCEVQAKMWILNLGKPVNIPVLSEAMAIELGANLLGEGIVFTVAATLLITEYNRGARKEEAKEKARTEELDSLVNRLTDLYFRLEQQDTQIRELTRTVVALDKKGFTFFKKQTSPTISESSKPVEKIESKTPQKPSSPLATPISNELRSGELHSLVLQAAVSIQEDITGQEDGYVDDSILTSALQYLENDIFRRPVCVK